MVRSSSHVELLAVVVEGGCLQNDTGSLPRRTPSIELLAMSEVLQMSLSGMMAHRTTLVVFRRELPVSSCLLCRRCCRCRCRG
jgi:hypothetical protein